MKHWRRGLIALTIVLALGALAGYLWQRFYGPPEPVVVTVAAGPEISDSYLLMVEVSEVIARHIPNFTLKVLATAGSGQNVQLLQNGQADFAVVQSNSPAVSRTRLVAHLFPNVYLLLVQPDSGIRSVGDLAGKRVAVPPFGTGDLQSFWQIGDHYDLPIETLKWQAMSLSEALIGMENGDVDAMFLVQAPRNAPIVKLIEDMALGNKPLPRFIPVSQSAAMALKRPFLTSAVLPRGTYLGDPPVPARDIPTVSIEQLLMAGGDADPAIVQAVTAILFEQRSDILLRTPLALYIKGPDLDTGGASLPLHEGAERYYLRDEPGFLQANAEFIALLITIFGIGGSALLALRTRYSSSQKNKADSFNLDLLAIGRRATEAGSLGITAQCRRDIQGVLERMIDDLDNDRVTEEGFQSFALTWEAVRDLINDRTRELEKD